MSRAMGPLQWGRVALAVGAFLPSACANVVGIEDYTLASGVVVVDVDVDVESDAATGPFDGSSAIDSAEPGSDTAVDTIGSEPQPDTAPVSCTAADDATGAFVSSGGADEPACGSRAAPCMTISAGLARAASSGRKNVHVAAGVYVERLVLRGGVRVIGGYDAEFKPSCAANARELVVVQAPPTESMTVVAESLSEVATVERLTIRSKSATRVAAGQSVYGVFARGAATRVSLRDVHVVVESAGAGAPGVSGAPGTNGIDTCSPATGANGIDGSPGTPASEGSFGANGYTAAVSVSGGAGAAGANGRAGAIGSCVPCVSCVSKACVAVLREKSSCGATGLAGCGGTGGGPGAGGGSGGSSIGVYAWDAKVSIDESSIEVGDAGDGGAGGMGGAPGVGSAGANGSNGASCSVSCAISKGACTEIAASGSGGAAGGPGGRGGRGGVGGGGAGGWSVALVRGGSATISEERTMLSFGRAGSGAGGAKDGRAAARWP